MKSKGPIAYNDVPDNLVQVDLTGSVGLGGEDEAPLPRGQASRIRPQYPAMPCLPNDVRE
jgi:hypothetical protein